MNHNHLKSMYELAQAAQGQAVDIPSTRGGIEVIKAKRDGLTVFMVGDMIFDTLTDLCIFIEDMNRKK